MIYKKSSDDLKGGTSSWTVGGPSVSSFPMSNSTGGDNRVPEDDLEKSRAEFWPDKDLCFSSKTTSQLHVHTCSGRNRIIPLMRRPNTHSTPNKPVKLPRNQLLMRYVATSLVHTVTIRCYNTR